MENYIRRIYSYDIIHFRAIQVQAQVRKEFNPRVSTYSESKKIYNVNGDFSILGNTNMTLQNYSVGGINSNSSMIVVDKDNNSSTTNSSMAELKFSDENGASPECTKIVYAGLYWTGRTNSWVTTESKRKIKLKSPADIPDRYRRAGSD